MPFITFRATRIEDAIIRISRGKSPPRLTQCFLSHRFCSLSHTGNTPALPPTYLSHRVDDHEQAPRRHWMER